MYELHVRKTLTSLLKFVRGIVRDYAEVEVTWGTFRTLQSLRKQVQETLQPSDDDKNDETIVEVTQGTFNA
jgi:protein subunit release factor A